MSLDGSWSPTKTPQGYTTSRKSIDCTSVPQTDDGLRTLAANGNWSGVLALAEKLEQEKAHQNGLEHLPYVLVRITVYFKTQQIPFAISLVELLGDVENSAHYRDPTTGENLVPFSLRYICGAIPHYAGETRKAITNLERLLSICKEEGKKDKEQLWSGRALRVSRTLIPLYYSVGDYRAAVSLFEALLNDEEQRSRHAEYGKIELNPMKQILLLQQFACLCLQLGKIVSAEETIVKIQDCAAWYSDSGPSFRDYALNVEQMCEGFKYVFKGMFKEASEVFRALATQTSRTGDKEIVQAFDHMRTCNQVSYISCFTYSERESGKDPLTIMPSILSTMENFLKENPNNLLRSSGFLNQAARLYALSSGVKKETFAGLADLMEKHVLEKSSIPDLASLI